MFPTGARMMAKKSLKYIPVFGTYLQASGSVFIDRGNSAAAVESLRAAGEEIKKSHTSLWIFPEGTRTSRPYHDVRPFKKGAFHLAIRAGLPLVPVVVENYWNLYHNGVFNSGTFKVRGVNASSFICVSLLTVSKSSVLPPISTDGLTTADVNDFSVRVREQMLQVLYEISDPNAPPPPATPLEENISLSQTKDTPSPSAETPSNLIETTPVPYTADVAGSQPRDAPEERPVTPHSEVTSEGSVRRSENDTEDEEGMVLVGRPR
jgi:lysophosphatidate acyltransferase